MVINSFDKVLLLYYGRCDGYWVLNVNGLKFRINIHGSFKLIEILQLNGDIVYI